MPGAVAASWRILGVDLLLALAVGAVGGAVLTAVARLFRRRLPVPFLAALLTSAFLLATMGAGPSPLGWLLLCAVVLITAPVLGGWLGAAVGARRGRGPRPGRARTACAALAVVLVAAGGAWLAWPGPGAPERVAERGGPVPPDPTARGEHTVVVSTYGSAPTGGSERYGADVDLVTEPVDASEVVHGWEPGSARAGAWGFDATTVPVNATVWAPDGGGPHPLVLVVHGNSPHADNELGFAYLGELLASRGYVVASLDQSFLDTGLLDRAGGLRGADRARAWLVERHLDQWAAWERAGDGPARVEPDDVTLIGHSRGGEAVTVAAATRPEVGTVVALAPSDGAVADGTVLTGVDYLTVAGTHDADVGTFAGADQYTRTEVGPAGTKAAVAVYGANHSQFNSRWGRHDAGLGLAKHVLDTAALLDAEEQRRVTAAFVAGFLDDDVRGSLLGALPDAPWLPETDYRVAVATGDRSGVETFADDARPPEVQGGSAEVLPLPTRTGRADNTVLRVRPDRPGTAVTVPLDADAPEDGERLVVDLADAGEPGTGRTRPVVHLVATADDGRTASCPVTGDSGVPGPLPARTVKHALLQQGTTSEPHLHTHTVPLRCVEDAGTALADVTALGLRIEALSGSGVYLDDLGVVDAAERR